MMSLSIDIQDRRDRIAAIKEQALSTCCDKRWAGLMEMMALSSVVGHMIYSVYPTCAPLFHGPIVPRMGTPPTSCYIMGAIHSTKIPTGPTRKRGPPQKVDPFFRNFSGWTEPIH